MPPFYVAAAIALSSISATAQTSLQYAPGPADNPLRGLVPYVSADAWDQFPHSLEFRYFAMSDLMTGYDAFDWTPIENTLAITQGRGKQLIFRVMIEYPGKPSHLPHFLVEDGVNVTTWNDPNSGQVSHTPDYENPKLRRALSNFISALGKRYDGDPRIGYLTAGLLGSWGEWHTYPREDLWASKATQLVVLESLEKAFTRTPVLLRYPAGRGHYQQAANYDRSFGYHDDSFAWGTLDTGRESDSWFFIPLLKQAGALEKWKTQPIGGELRPEVWETTFTGTDHEQEQSFSECVEKTHVTWLMDSGLFQKKIAVSEDRKQQAIREIQKMGYEFHVSSWEQVEGEIRITVENRGAAPFYHDWPVELDNGERPIATFDLRKLLPGEKRTWTAPDKGEGPFRLRVPNPMPSGHPLRFANREQGDEWLTLP